MIVRFYFLFHVSTVLLSKNELRSTPLLSPPHPFIRSYLSRRLTCAVREEAANEVQYILYAVRKYIDITVTVITSRLRVVTIRGSRRVDDVRRPPQNRRGSRVPL